MAEGIGVIRVEFKICGVLSSLWGNRDVGIVSWLLDRDKGSLKARHPHIFSSDRLVAFEGLIHQLVLFIELLHHAKGFVRKRSWCITRFCLEIHAYSRLFSLNLTSQYLHRWNDFCRYLSALHKSFLTHIPRPKQNSVFRPLKPRSRRVLRFSSSPLWK